MDDWHERLSAVGWFLVHLDDVLSDMSVLHRVDDLDSVPADVFLPRMVRLALYEGAIRFRLQAESAKSSAASSEPAEGEPQPQPTAHTAEEFKALNKSKEYGPLGLHQRTGVFDLG